MIGVGDAHQELTMFTNTFLVKNIYASVLFDIGSDKCFISHKFRSMVNHKSCKVNESYMVQVPNSQIESTL